MTDPQRAAFEAAFEKHMKGWWYEGDADVTTAARYAFEAGIKWQAAQTADAGREAVAVIGSDFRLLYTDPGSITAIAKKHGLKVGDTLYKRPTAHSGPVAWQVRRADGRIDGVPIQWENCTKELYEATLATGRYAGYENGPRCEVRALTIDGSAINAELVEALEALMDHFDKASYDEAFAKARAALSRAKEQKS